MNLLFESLKQCHLPLLLKWLNSTHVRQFWDNEMTWTEHMIQEKYGTYVKGYKLTDGMRKPIHSFVINLEGNPIGYIQYYNAFDFKREDFAVENMWKEMNQSLAALDLYIGEVDYLGKGIGSEIIKQFLRDHVFKTFDACLVDPEKNNQSAIRAYSKSGFSIYNEAGSSVIMIAKKNMTN